MFHYYLGEICIAQHHHHHRYLTCLCSFYLHALSLGKNLILANILYNIIVVITLMGFQFLQLQLLTRAENTTIIIST